MAVGIVGLGSIWALASGSAVVDFSVEIKAASSGITVTAPNGGESWTIGDSHNITWTADGSISDVMIELQRSVAGSWETIVAATTNDGSYPWVVDGPATTTAAIRVSKVGDASVNDTSDAVFSIVSPAVTPSPGGGGAPQILINDVTPNTVANSADAVVHVEGQNFDSNVKVRLNATVLSRVTWQDSRNFEVIVPKGFKEGVYSFSVFDNNGGYAVWGSLFRVVGVTPSQPAPNLFYASKLVAQSDTMLTMTVGEETTVWMQFMNTGTLPWTNFGKNPVRLGTASPRDRLSRFKATWFSGWVLKNRPANVARVGQAAGGKQTINPGEVGQFTFKIKAPSQSGRYTENFGTVVEFIQWMGGTAKLNITVVPKVSVKKPVAQPTTPSVTVPKKLDIWDVDLPEAPEEFHDTTETIFRFFGSMLDKLFGSLIRGISR